MKEIEEIRAEIERLEEDERYQQKPALVEINAPLALIQVEIESRIRTLKWVIN